MYFFWPAILGIIQGITEFLPVSSSAHLIVIPYLTSLPTLGLAFDVAVHLGTLVALLIALKGEIIIIIKSLFSKGQNQFKKLAYILLVATFPAGFVGILAGSFIEEKLRSPLIIACSLIFWAGVLYFVQWLSNKKVNKQKDIVAIGYKKGLFIGLVQALSLIPGTSRSGITITAGLFSGLTKSAAAKFSFLLSIPLIAGAGLIEGLSLYENNFIDVNFGSLLIGFIAAFFSGWLAIKFLLKFTQKYSYNVFVVYRIILGLIIIFLLG